MSVRTWLGLLAGLLVLGVSSLSHAQCSKDTDCKGERICEEGACVDPEPAAPATAGSSAVPSTPLEAEPAAASPAAPAAAAPAPPGDAGRPPLGAEPAYEPEPAAPPAPARTKRHSTGMMTAGIVMVAVAPVLLLTALLANSKQDSCESAGASFGTGGFESFDSNSDCGKYDSTIYVGGLGGIALLGVGIPLIVIGGKRKQPTTARVSPWATPQAAGLRLRLEL